MDSSKDGNDSGETESANNQTTGAASEANPSGSTGSAAFIYELGNNDVLLGRGAPLFSAVGNVRFRELIRARKAEYTASASTRTKERIARDIFDAITARRGRFLRRAGSGGGGGGSEDTSSSAAAAWEVVSDEAAINKVKQALRRKEAPIPVSEQADQQQQATLDNFGGGTGGDGGGGGGSGSSVAQQSSSDVSSMPAVFSLDHGAMAYQQRLQQQQQLPIASFTTLGQQQQQQQQLELLWRQFLERETSTKMAAAAAALAEAQGGAQLQPNLRVDTILEAEILQRRLRQQQQQSMDHHSLYLSGSSPAAAAAAAAAASSQLERENQLLRMALSASLGHHPAVPGSSSSAGLRGALQSGHYHLPTIFSRDRSGSERVAAHPAGRSSSLEPFNQLPPYHPVQDMRLPTAAALPITSPPPVGQDHGKLSPNKRHEPYKSAPGGGGGSSSSSSGTSNHSDDDDGKAMRRETKKPRAL